MPPKHIQITNSLQTLHSNQSYRNIDSVYSYSGTNFKLLSSSTKHEALIAKPANGFKQEGPGIRRNGCMSRYSVVSTCGYSLYSAAYTVKGSVHRHQVGRLTRGGCVGIVTV
eukprot:3432700-Pleurochrysis_carterae.AAC.1